MAVSAVPVDGAFVHEPVGKIDFDAIDQEDWLEKKVGRRDREDAVADDSDDVVASEEEAPASESPEGETQDDPDVEDDEAGEPDEAPAEESTEPETLLAGEFRTPSELEQSYVALKQEAGDTSRALAAQRDMSLRLQWQTQKVVVPTEPVRFDSLPPADQDKIAAMARTQGFENPQQLLYHSWTLDVARAEAHNRAIDHQSAEHERRFGDALQQLSAYVNKPEHRDYAAAIQSEWSAHPELFEAMQLLNPEQMLAAGKHLTDLVVRAAASEARGKTFDAEVKRARQSGREEHRKTRQAKMGGVTEASRPNPVTVGKPNPKPTQGSRVRAKLAELDDYAKQDRYT